MSVQSIPLHFLTLQLHFMQRSILHLHHPLQRFLAFRSPDESQFSQQWEVDCYLFNAHLPTSARKLTDFVKNCLATLVTVLVSGAASCYHRRRYRCSNSWDVPPWHRSTSRPLSSTACASATSKLRPHASHHRNLALPLLALLVYQGLIKIN